MKKPKTTQPATLHLRRQYFTIKARYPDTILLFRDGDTYLAFDDAPTVESVTGSPVTTCATAERAISMLVEAGHKVAVIEQPS